MEAVDIVDALMEIIPTFAVAAACGLFLWRLIVEYRQGPLK